MNSEAIRHRIVVAADPNTIMDIVADLEAYPEWQPDLKEVEVLETDEDGWARRARLEASAMGLTVRVELEYTYADMEMRWRLLDSDWLTRNDGAYILADRGDGTTEVTYELEVETSISVPGFLREQIANRVIESALHGLKHRAEAPGPGSAR